MYTKCERQREREREKINRDSACLCVYIYYTNIYMNITMRTAQGIQDGARG